MHIRVKWLAIAAALLALAWSREGHALVRAGEDAPDFALQQLGGGQVSLSDFRGKVVLINLFGFN